MRRISTLLTAVVLVLGCESSPKPKSQTSARPAAPTAVELDADALVQTAQLLRDREFARPPALEAVDRFDPGEPPGCAGRCDEERRLLTRILFADAGPVVPAALARWDAQTNVVRWNAAITDRRAVRAAVLAELVVALDGLPTPEADAWDAHLAETALRNGAGVFVAALDQARGRADRIDASLLAMRPEAIYDLQFGPARFVDGFATREGFAFVAAMFRAGGWSAVELAHNERPTRTQQIVRPDRYLEGAGESRWDLPPEPAQARTEAGYALTLEGSIGAALFVEWLGRHVPAALARAGYVGFEADRYRIFTHPDGRWAFEWVSLWNLPSTAEQVMTALDAGLRVRTDGASFSVLRKGATVAVVGDSTSKADLAVFGTALVEALPVFDPPRPRGVVFVPTPVDRIASRPQATSIAPVPWTDAATGVSLDLGALGRDWALFPTAEPNLPWFAKHSSGAVLQFLVEPQPLFDPPFDDDAYQELVRARFESTVDAVPTVRRSDVPAASTLVIDATGRIADRPAEGPVHLRAWHIHHAPFVTTLSLQSPPADFDALLPSVDALLASMSVPTAPAGTPGVIEFRVED